MTLTLEEGRQHELPCGNGQMSDLTDKDLKVALRTTVPKSNSEADVAGLELKTVCSTGNDEGPWWLSGDNFSGAVGKGTRYREKWK